MRGLLACGLGLLVFGSAVTAGDTKDDLAKLQGKWVGEADGKKVTMTFKKDTYALDFDGIGTFTGPFKTDVSKKPKEMDLTVDDGPMFKGMTARAIFLVDGDTLKWCANHPGGDARPKEFPAKEGESKEMYIVFKRAK